IVDHDDDHHVRLVLPTDSTLRARDVPVTWLTLREAIDALVELPANAPCGRSTQAWAHATRAGLQLLARGRLLPTADVDGTDLWRAGPLDSADIAYWKQLADALPAHAHATEVPDSAPRRVTSPAWLLGRFRDAVVDTYVRTEAAAEAAGHQPFASTDRHVVLGSTSWLSATSTVTSSEISVALRL